jgi:hypothetical protein
MPSSKKMVRGFKNLPGGVKIELLPTTPAWTSGLDSDAELQPLFAQMCVAFGAALSHPNQYHQLGLAATPQ